MHLSKRSDPKYPLRAVLSDGSKLIIPRQQKFSNPWLRKHGCSLMAEYIALQWLGVKKYPIRLLSWHKKHTPDEIAAKVMVKGVAEGIDKLSDGKVVFTRTVTTEKISKALSEGCFVIFEQKDPIHTVIVFRDKDGTFFASNGSVKKTSAARMARTALTSTKYRGMITIYKEKTS